MLVQGHQTFAVADFEADIPLALAKAAHEGTSMDPDQRAEQERSGYAATLLADFHALERLATTPEERSTLVQEFARYRLGYRRRYLVQLGARSRCVSTFIAGPSNFPATRMRKRSDSYDRRVADLLAFRARALDAIRRVLSPELRPIMTGDVDAITRLEAEIASVEAKQKHMKAVNAAVRKHAKEGDEAQVAALGALGVSAPLARELIVPDCMGRAGYADYELKNNNANLRRLRTRLTEVTAAKAAPTREVEGADGVRFEDCPADNRVRLFFPGKPAETVRVALKAHGFRWAPSLDCWQAYRNARSLTHAREVAGM